jgi:putative inorganic carbon (HCO3(-)) transporter
MPNPATHAAVGSAEGGGTDAPEHESRVPWLLRWQGLFASSSGPLARNLPLLAGLVLCALMAGLPLVTRAGLSLLILSSGLLWLIWALCTPAGRIGPISGWLLLMLGLAVLATGFSPVPTAAAKGLLKLVSYLGVYALMRQLLATAPVWWDRIVAALLGGQLITAVIGIRQLYADSSALARWSDPNSVAEGTVRIYSTLGNPNLLAGYLLPILPLAAVAMLCWRRPMARLFALASLVFGLVALVLTYSRGAWLGMVASLGTLLLLLALRLSPPGRPCGGSCSPCCCWWAGAGPGALLVSQVEPLRVRVLSLVAGREDSSNNFRINVWTSALAMVRDRPWLGIGPGNNAFNLIYPLYQQPKFNALSAYSVPLELLVEGGIPGLLAGLGLLWSSLPGGAVPVDGHGASGAAGLAAVAVFVGLGVQGLTDTIFFRPEVQLVALFSLATLAASSSPSMSPSSRLPLGCSRRKLAAGPLEEAPVAEGGGMLAGFDAGQTHTLCRLAEAATGRVLAEAEGPGVSHLAAVGGPERFAEALETSLTRARQRIGSRFRLRAAAVGASGIERGSAVAEEGERLAAQALGLDPARVVVTGDERTALRGAFCGGEGIVVISGTGTITVGRGPHGREHRCGGWGWLLDGAGSAMDIGRDDSSLRTNLWAALGEGRVTPQRIKAMVVDPGFGAAGFARLAPAVNALAEAADPDAMAVLERSAAGLAAMVAGVARTLGLEDGEVCGLGGALEHLSWFAGAYQRSLALALPQARLVPPRGDACQGALQLAAQLLETTATLSSG